MGQTCLCQYLGLTCHHPDTFLRLPVSVRERIYKHAGLITDTLIECPIPCDLYEFTHNILRVCRTTRGEAEGIILSQNTIALTQDNIDEGLLYLGGLSPYACSKLRNLYVHLYSPRDPRFWRRGRPHPPSLRWRRIEMWQWAATHILSHTSPQRLRLHLICDMGDINMNKTDAVLQPLRDFPGVLLELELRIADRKYPHLCALARETALQAESPDLTARSGCFRFLDLPKEIRQHIFAYTNLVAPQRKIQWTHKEGFAIISHCCVCDCSICREADLHRGLTFNGCFTRSSDSEDFCSMHHSAYSSRCTQGSVLPLC